MQQYHEAGYDSYITGLCFLRLLSLNMTGGKLEFEKASKFLNRIFLMRCSMDYLNLSGSDQIPDLSSVFHVSGFPVTWKTRDIQQQFKGTVGNTVVKWIDDKNCLVHVIEKDKCHLVKELQVEFSVKPYQNVNQPPAEEVIVKKRKRDSDACVIF
jgi:poly(A)-specific ribonuclease